MLAVTAMRSKLAAIVLSTSTVFRIRGFREQRGPEHAGGSVHRVTAVQEAVMGYRLIPVFRPRIYVRPPQCRNFAVHGIPAVTRFVGHQGPLRFFSCPVCGRNFTRSV